MTFSENYAFEVLQSRRIRQQRALFWAKILSFVLMILVAVTLRSEPQLRVALFTAVTDVAMQVMGKTDQAEDRPETAHPTAMLQNPDLKEMLSAAPMLLSPPAPSPQTSATQQDRAAVRIKVNRPGLASDPSTTFKRVRPPD